MTDPETDYTEMSLVERPTIEKFDELGWETCDAGDEQPGPGSMLGRDRPGQVVLTERLRPRLEAFNPDVPAEAIDHALDKITKSRKAMGPVVANKEVYEMLTGEVSVSYRGEDGEEISEDVRVIDWKDPKENDFLLVSQMTIDGEMYTKRPDLIGFVNGLPLLVVELKRPGVDVKEGYDKNISDYKRTIPQLFWYNQAIMISNGTDTRVGSMSADWEHFGQWKKRVEEDQREISLERALKATGRPDRFMDLVENFVLYTTAWGDLNKVLAKNHQFVGTNEAYDALETLEDDEQRLGVYWHTQGSGKSYSMAFFAEKVFRKMEGNWTFVIITDRLDLDDQIYSTFADADLVEDTKKKPVRADSGDQLRELLKGDQKYVFTTIQKFQTEDEESSYPLLSERDDIIVMTDEAHRTQYGTLAMNMRKALPNARYMAYTGTPLMEDEATREQFGDYVSVYDFAASEQDGATVPLYYENRIPEVNLDEELLEQGLEEIVEEYNLTEDEEDKLSREYSRRAKFLKRDDRLETVAEDLAVHFPQRGFKGKGMVVSIDRFTTVRMYNKVQKYWEKRIEEIENELRFASGEQKEELEQELEFMQSTEMNVVISKSQNEIGEFEKRGVDIEPHRRKMENQDLKTRFKDPDDHFRLVFLCAKWMTGFDCPSCSSLYLDKPMKNHTLMQAIARTNRRFEGKGNGLIVDYVGLLRKLNKALAIYAKGERGKGAAKQEEMPVRQKEEIIEALSEELEGIKTFCANHGIDLEGIIHEGEYNIIGAIEEAGEKLLESGEIKERFLKKARNVRRLFRAILPDPQVEQHASVCKLIERIEDYIKSLSETPDIGHVEQDMEDLLDEVVDVVPPVKEPGRSYGEGERYNLSKIDFDALKEQFDRSENRASRAERLRNLLKQKVQVMTRKNKHREDLLERFEQIIEEYNAGSKNVEQHYQELLEFAESLEDEEQRKIREGLDEEQLAVFDILTNPEPELDPEEEDEVKQVAKELLEILKQEKLVIDWKNRQKSQNKVKVAIEDELIKLPADKYNKEIFDEKKQRIFNHVFESYDGEGNNIYDRSRGEVPA